MYLLYFNVEYVKKLTMINNCRISYKIVIPIKRAINPMFNLLIIRKTVLYGKKQHKIALINRLPSSGGNGIRLNMITNS